MRTLPSIVLVSALSVVAVANLSAADWPKYRGPRQDGISTEKDWLGEWPGGQPRRVWKVAVGTGFSSVAVVGGRVFTVGSDGKKKGGKDTVYCLAEATGETVWSFAYPQDLDPKYYEGGPGATPTVEDGRVYVVGRHGAVHCLDAADGKVVWTRDVHKELGVEIPDWGFNGSVHLEGNLAVLNAGSFGVALDKSTGKEVWVSGKDGAGYGTPVPFASGGRRLLAMFAAKSVVAIEPATGREVWRLPWKTDYGVNSSDPVIVGDTLWISSGYGTGGAAYDISGAKPRQLWFNKEIRAHVASSVVIGGFVYGVDGQAGDKDSSLKCLDLKTGAVRWTSPKAATGNLAAAAGGRLLWLTGTGELVVVDAKPDAYHEVVRAQASGGLHWTAPVLANGRVYVRNARGELVCLDVRGGKTS